MRNIVLIILLLICGTLYAAEMIKDFQPGSVPVLNEELRQIRNRLELLEGRVYDLENP